MRGGLRTIGAASGAAAAGCSPAGRRCGSTGIHFACSGQLPSKTCAPRLESKRQNDKPLGEALEHVNVMAGTPGPDKRTVLRDV